MSICEAQSAKLKGLLQLNNGARIEEVLEATLKTLSGSLLEEEKHTANFCWEENATFDQFSILVSAAEEMRHTFNADCDALTIPTSTAESVARREKKEVCAKCGTTQSPQWRSKRTLCNACGLQDAYDTDTRAERNTSAYREMQKRNNAARKARFARAADVIKTGGGTPSKKHQRLKCESCGVTTSKHWRFKGTLCNSCGLGGQKYLDKQPQ